MRQFNAFKYASLMRETLWSIIQEINSHLGFNFATYSDEYLAR